jgi:hypothetical protein
MKTSTILTISGLSLIFTSVLTWLSAHYDVSFEDAPRGSHKKLGPKGRKMTFTATHMLFFLGFVLLVVSQLTIEEFNVSSKPEAVETEIQTGECVAPCKSITNKFKCRDTNGCIFTDWNGTEDYGCWCKKPTGSIVIPNFPLVSNTETCDSKYPCCTENCCKENYKFCLTSCNALARLWNPNCLGDCLKQRGLCSGACLGYLGSNIGCTS